MYLKSCLCSVSCRLCCLYWWLPCILYLCPCTCFVVDMFPYSYSTTGCVNDLWLALTNYACIMFWDYVLNVFHATEQTLTVFRLKILCNLWPAGKCVSTRLRKLRAMFVLTFLLKRGLNQMMLRCLFLRDWCVTCVMYSSLCVKLLCPSTVWYACCILKSLLVRWECWNTLINRYM